MQEVLNEPLFFSRNSLEHLLFFVLVMRALEFVLFLGCQLLLVDANEVVFEDLLSLHLFLGCAVVVYLEVHIGHHFVDKVF